jgi:hypothetical protein
MIRQPLEETPGKHRKATGWAGLIPNTWEPIADLAEDWKAIAGGVTALIAG